MMQQRRRTTAPAAAPAVVVLLALVGAAAAYSAKDPRSGQLSPSILMMGEFDWALSTGGDGKPWSRCLDMVWRARSVVKGNRLNFVPTHHWMPREDGFGVSNFCYLHTEGGGDKGTCKSWTPGKLAEFKKSMTLCFAEALRQGFIPYVRPHLDDGLNRGIWRNGLMFSPLDKYGGYSYKDVMVDPLAEAMRDALAITAAEGTLVSPPDKQRPTVYMGLQGEMSATIMRYTSAWASLVPHIKSTVGSKHADVKVGIGLNFNALDMSESHKVEPGLFGFMIGSGQRASRYPVPPIDGAGINDLLSNKIDFVGISAYAPYSGPFFGLSEFENSAFNVGDSLRNLGNGVCLSCLVNAGKLELHYSEFGVGGGQEGNGAMAQNALWAAKQPWAGVAGLYDAGRDPWKRPDLAEFRRNFYQKAMEWMSKPGSKTYQVSEIFVWDMASWDLFGIYPEASGPSGSYRDDGLMGTISRHNINVIASKAAAMGGPDAGAAAEVAMETPGVGAGAGASSSGSSGAVPAAPAPQPAAAAPAPQGWQPQERPVPEEAPRAAAPAPAPAPAAAAPAPAGGRRCFVFCFGRR